MTALPWPPLLVSVSSRSSSCVPGDDVLRPGQYALAVRSDFNSPSVSHCEPDPQLCLQRADMRRDDRLRDVQRLCGAGDAFETRDRREDLELMERQLRTKKAHFIAE